MKIKIVKKEVLSMDISLLENSQSQWKEWNLVPNEHFKLCAYISSKVSGVNIIDAGTSTGNSAIALAYNPKNKVTTYDIMPNDYESFKKYENIQPIQKDINIESDEVILNAPVILLDVDPHDGIQEKVFTDRLREINYSGFLLCDDIHLNGEMRDWWNSLIEEKKYDLTDIGHMHGTGLVCYGDFDVTII